MTYVSKTLGIIDTDNSFVLTSGGGTLLGAGGDHTEGIWVDVSQYTLATVSILTDASTIQPGEIQFLTAHDDAQAHTGFVPRDVKQSNFDIPKTFLIAEKWLQIKYVNGDVAQNGTYFSLQVTLHKAKPADISQVPRDEIRFATESRPVRLANDFSLDRNQGNIQFSKAKRKFGSDAVSTALETIWSGAALNYTFPIAAEVLNIRAGVATDAVGSTGARVITVQGLDANWDEIEEDINTNGTSDSSATTASFIRVNKAFVKEVGTYHGTNDGAIIIENASGVELANIRVGEGSTDQAIVSVPAGYTAYISEVHFSVGDGNSADIRLWSLMGADDVTGPTYNAKRLEAGVEDFKGFADVSQHTMLKVSEKSDIWAQAERITGSGTAKVRVDFNYALEKN